MRELLAHAADLGVQVHVAHLPAPYRGFYDADARRVVYGFNLTPIERRSVLAHELGHAFYNHRGHGDARQEAAADLYAARLLIDPVALAHASAGAPPLLTVADELRVELRLLQVFLRHDVHRMSALTVVRPRMGRGQAGYLVSSSLGE